MLNFFKTALTAALLLPASLVAAAPTLNQLEARQTGVSTGVSTAASAAASTVASTAASSNYWLAGVKRQGTVAFGNNTAFKIYRNVKDYGAVGDGSTDDTAAINKAITDGQRCGQGCDSSTTTPAIIYFPPGTYAVSKPLVQLYYTQFIGDAVNVPTLKALPSFQGMAVIDSDPYLDSGANWYTNQNNFYRQVRNFVIDLTSMPASSGAGIHWQVAQATSLQNIVFNMVKGASSKQQGIFMDNGSGGFMSDLTFNGGNYGAFFGNQQFTVRNMTFNNVNTAIYMNWNWLFTIKGVQINNCGVGIDVGSTVTVGSTVVQDVVFKNTPIGIRSGFEAGKWSNATLIVDNVDFTGCQTAVQGSLKNDTLLAGGSKTASWIQGHGYTNGQVSNSTKRDATQQISMAGPAGSSTKPKQLITSSGTVFERSKPQYANLPASSFISVKSKGAKGDGVTDDTKALQSILSSAPNGSVVYFDHGAYLVKDTVTVPAGVKIVGEIWPIIMADGASFNDASKPKPVFQIGKAGDVGCVEIQDLVFETKGSAPGAIMMEWNINADTQGSAAMWDTHFRIGGTAGTGLQSDTCSMNNGTTHGYNPACVGAFMLLHVTKSASAYVENSWGWVADHELDLADHKQIDIYNGRGFLIESTNAAWFYGTSVEHSQFYNYQLNNAANVYMGAIQTETAYMQSNPGALSGGFTPMASFLDPTFADCKNTTAGGANTCAKTWGLRMINSQDVHVYGAGLYSFFDNYNQACLATESCQDNIVSIENCTQSVYLYGLNTKASTNMVSLNGKSMVNQADNSNNFCQTVAVFEAA